MPLINSALPAGTPQVTMEFTIAVKRLLTAITGDHLRCIGYVIMHELCHMKYHNHSKSFYALLTRCQPDWRNPKEILEKVVMWRLGISTIWLYTKPKLPLGKFNWMRLSAAAFDLAVENCFNIPFFRLRSSVLYHLWSVFCHLPSVSDFRIQTPLSALSSFPILAPCALNHVPAFSLWAFSFEHLYALNS